MKKLISLAICLVFSLPMTILADNPQKELKERHEVKEKRVIVKTTGDADERHLSRVLEWVESESGDEEDIEVFVTLDDAGKGRAHAVAFTDSIRAPRPHRRHEPLSQAAANCVLKNISKVNSDAAAHLLKQACRSLNPSESNLNE